MLSEVAGCDAAHVLASVQTRFIAGTKQSADVKSSYAAFYGCIQVFVGLCGRNAAAPSTYNWGNVSCLVFKPNPQLMSPRPWNTQSVTHIVPAL